MNKLLAILWMIFITAFLILFITSNSNAFDCEKAFLNPLVYRMCKTEETMILEETEKIKVRRDNFAKLILEDAGKVNKKQELQAALASTNKSPSEEYLINGFIYKNKTLLEDINYQDWKLTASKDEMETIMNNFYDKALAKK